MRKYLIGLLVLAVLLTVPVITFADDPVTIRYFTFSAAPDHLDDLNEMIQIFEAEHPNIHVVVETAPWGDYWTKLPTLVAGGQAPDVFELNYENFVTYASRGLLLNLETPAAGDAAFNAGVYYPRAYGAFQYKGMQLGLPATFSTVMLFYNKDLFDAAGVSYPEPDWTWDDAVAAAKELTDLANGVWGLHSPVQFWEFYKKVAQNGGSFFNSIDGSVTVNSAQCVEALEKMVGFITEDGVMPSASDMGGMSDGDMFLSGQLAMNVTGIWMFAAFADAPFSWDIQVEPGFTEHATHFFANAVSVFAGSQHPEEAWEWVKFFTSSPEMARIRVASGWELPALDNPTYFADYLNLTPPDNREAVFESLNYAIVPPVIERQNEMQDTIGLLIERVVLGQMTAQEALDQAKTEIEELLK